VAVMKRIFVSTIMLTGFLTACAPQVVPAPEAPSLLCARPESGIIRPESPGLPEVKLTGPIMITMLAPIVDPVNPHSFLLIWSKDNAGFLTSDLNGQFYLGENETLSGKQEFMPSGVVYSGCRPY
jgi:hypothetical protein